MTGWIDLTHPISPDLPRLPQFAAPMIERLPIAGADGAPARVLVRPDGRG